ncbi:MAG: ATP-binding protein [Pseudomonadota bacterium]
MHTPSAQMDFAASSPVAETSGVAFPNPLILIAADDGALRHVIIEALSPQYRTAGALDGSQVLHMAATLHPDLILIDAALTTPDGAPAARALCAHPAARDTPIILLTEKADGALRAELLRAGAHDYLIKPFAAEELCVRVRNQIALKRTREILQQELPTQGQDVEELANVVTFHKRALQTTLGSLRKKEELLSLVLETLPVGVWVTDKKGKITLENRAGQKIWGGPYENGVEHYERYKGWWLDGRRIEPDEWALARALHHGKTSLDEVIDIECFDGSRKTILNSAAPIRDADQTILGAIVVNQDITDMRRASEEIRLLNQTLERRVRKRTKQLEEINKELEAFSYSVSHDLRAPLRHISGFADILHERAAAMLDADSLRYLKIITDAARKAGHMIDDLLAFSRVGRTTMQRTTVPMDQLLQEVRDDLHLETTQRAITWEISDLPAVEGDAALLRLVLQNLISNAVKYTCRRDQARIGVRCDEEKDFYVFAVSDNGVGFDMQYSNKLFGVFQRLHSETEFEGTGIGLANVRRIIERHGGRAWAQGAVDGGATFYFSLPRVKNEGKNSKAQAHPLSGR